jgi:hypothetical protein
LGILKRFSTTLGRTSEGLGELFEGDHQCVIDPSKVCLLPMGIAGRTKWRLFSLHFGPSEVGETTEQN